MFHIEKPDVLKIAIIIATKNRHSVLRRMLESLNKQSYTITEVIVVDCSDGNMTKDVVESFNHSFPVLVYVHTLPGLTLQRNIGISKLRSAPQIVCFFDDDVELDQLYIEAIVHKFESDKSIVGVSGNIVNEKRRIFFDRIIRRFFFITDNTTGKLLLSGDVGHIFAPVEDKEVDVLSGCNMSYRSNILFEYNLRFDEQLKDYAYMEDQDFSFRALKYGTLVQVSDAKLVHHETTIARQKQRQLFASYIIHSYYLLKKNLSPNIVNYVCYCWRLMGKLIDALAKSIILRTWEPLIGWGIGIFKINTLAKKIV